MKINLPLLTIPVVSAFLLCLVQTTSFAQFSYYDDDRILSLEAGIGGAAYFGDLTEKTIPLKQAKLATTVGLSYSITTQIRPMLTASFMQLGADDKNNTRQNLRDRNLNFRSRVIDVSLGLRYHFLTPSVSLFTPYVYGGIGVFHFNPYTTDRNGTRQFLQPLGTEGQQLPNASKAPYHLTQLQIPFGVGLNYILNNKISVALDATFRKLFTDYLDDVSTFYPDSTSLSRQNPVLPSLAYRGGEVRPNVGYPSSTLPRGNPKKNDLYYTVGLKVMYQLR